jgi:hypothetical protein
MPRLKNRIVPTEPMTIPVFFNLLGHTMFGNEWQHAESIEADHQQELVTVPFQNPERFMIQLASQQLLGVLSSGSIKVKMEPLTQDESHSVLTRLEQWDWDNQKKIYKAEKRRARTSKPEPVEPSDEEEFEEEEDGEKKNKPGTRRGADRTLGIVDYEPNKHFKPTGYYESISLTVKPEYWRHPTAKATLASNERQEIPASCLYLEGGWTSIFHFDVPLGDVPWGAKKFKGKLGINDAESAFKKVTEWPDTDDVLGWGEAYRQYSRKFWPEIVAIAWRLIAVKRWSVDEVKIKTLAEAIGDQLHAQYENELPKHLLVSDESLFALASKIVGQFKLKNKALEERVLVFPRRE